MVFWNGVDAVECSGIVIQKLQAVLAQNGYLFSASLNDNLKLASPRTDKFSASLQDVGLSDWFNTLPEGLDTWLGDNGSQLSGGERQRLLLARTLLMERPIILADEPFSNLDLASEREILDCLLHSEANPACILATHRLIRMDQFDEILVLDGGRVIQRGTHDQLLSMTGLYRELWQQQNNRFTYDL
jgi:ABC-type transport system involved in cytochrome bd biosynthesis fused ATPase/permease subunit